MPSAEILYDTDMSGWPPTSYHVKLEEPLRRYNAETGEPEDYEYIALTVQEADPKQAYVFPTDAEGKFVDDQMIPMRRKDYALPHVVLIQLGYTLTN